ncbi:MAG: hypothetical protein WC091_25435 [Sulfuricellaceae bacterium]
MKKLLSFVLVLAAVAASAATYPNKFVTNATPENVAWFPILLYLPITNATGLATDGDGKIIAGSGGGTTYSNLTETGYTLNVRSNLTVGLNQTNAGNVYNTGTNWAAKLRVGGAAESADAVNVTGSIKASTTLVAGTSISVGNNYGVYNANANEAILFTSSPSQVALRTSGVNKFLLDASGNVSVTGVSRSTNGFIPQIKAAFSTNYTLADSDAVAFCTGTNQLITLPSAPDAGKTYTINVASTTGSAIVTNSTGAQTIKGVLSITIPSTNMVTVIFDGVAWW